MRTLKLTEEQVEYLHDLVQNERSEILYLMSESIRKLQPLVADDKRLETAAIIKIAAGIKIQEQEFKEAQEVLEILSAE